MVKEVRLSTCGEVGQVGGWRGSILRTCPIELLLGQTVGVCKGGVIQIVDWAIPARLEGDHVVLQLPKGLAPYEAPYSAG